MTTTITSTIRLQLSHPPLGNRSSGSPDFNFCFHGATPRCGSIYHNQYTSPTKSQTRLSSISYFGYHLSFSLQVLGHYIKSHGCDEGIDASGITYISFWRAFRLVLRGTCPEMVMKTTFCDPEPWLQHWVITLRLTSWVSAVFVRTCSRKWYQPTSLIQSLSIFVG